MFEKLGDVRSRSVTMGKIADIYQSRGELEEALRIQREEQLPVYEKLGDIRSRAVTMGKIADIYQLRGELEEALRIRQTEVLPIMKRLNDKRGLLVEQANIAIGLLTRNKKGDRERAISLLNAAHASALEMRIPEAGQIAGILRQIGA